MPCFQYCLFGRFHIEFFTFQNLHTTRRWKCNIYLVKNVKVQCVMNEHSTFKLDRQLNTVSRSTIKQFNSIKNNYTSIITVT